MRKILVFLCISIVSCLFAPVQAQVKTMGKTPVPPATVEGRVDSLNQLGFEVKRQDIDQALNLLHGALLLAQKHAYKKGEAISYLYEAGIYQQNGYAKRALSLYYKSLQISQVAKDTFNIARAKQQIATALKDAQKLAEAEELYEETLENYIALQQWNDVVNVKNNLGLVELAEKEFADAEAYFTQALQESQKRNYQYGYKKSHFNLGLLYLETGKLSKAKQHFTKALALDQATNDRYGISLAQSQLALIASHEGKHQEAVYLAITALQAARSINASQLEIEAMENLAIIYKGQRNYLLVAAWQDTLLQKQRQLFDLERTYAINFLDILKEKQDEQLAYEKEAVLASQKAEITYYALGMALVILLALSIITYLWYRNYLKARNANKELAIKNEVIEKHSLAMEALNKAITRQNESLEEANLMKDKLLSILSHDLRGPLANTKGILQLINNGLLSAEQYKPLLKELEKQYVRSLSLLENLLFWIKSQMKGDPIVPEEINLKSLLDKLIDEQEASLQNKGITVSNDVAPELSVVGDHEMLKVIFRNLLSNSVKFTRKEGKVAVSAATENEILVKIKDQGIGISEATLKKIRRKKYFSTNGTENESGSGFGLMICEELISRHGGELIVESQVNEGSLFAVKLPAQVVA